jgi:hypothetical protein
MSRSHALALSLALVLTSLASTAEAQHALPVEALTFDGLTVRSVRAPDAEELPVRVVLGTAQEAQYRVDVWVAGSRDEATAMLSARLGSLSTLGLAPRSDLGRARAFATAPSGPSGLVALAIENVVLVVRAIEGGDAIALAAHLAQAVVASAPPAASAPSAPAPLTDVLTLQEPTGALDWLVTCGGACEARRIDRAFRVCRTGEGELDVAVHVVDAFLRAQHVRTSH